MNEHFMHGFIDELEKVAKRKGATIGGAIFGPLGGLFAEKGKGWAAAGGGLLGAAGGGTLGHLLGLALGSGPRANMARHALISLGSMAGGGLGAYLGHGPDTPAKVSALRRLMKRMKKVKK